MVRQRRSTERQRANHRGSADAAAGCGVDMPEMPWADACERVAAEKVAPSGQLPVQDYPGGVGAGGGMPGARGADRTGALGRGVEPVLACPVLILISCFEQFHAGYRIESVGKIQTMATPIRIATSVHMKPLLMLITPWYVSA